MLKVGIAIYIKHVFDGKTKEFFLNVKVHYTVQYSTVHVYQKNKAVQTNFCMISLNQWFDNNCCFLLNEHSVDAVSLKHMNFNPVVCLWIYQP